MSHFKSATFEQGAHFIGLGATTAANMKELGYGG
jgi:hypothetical protein